jgi:hypothetical protein
MCASILCFAFFAVVTLFGIVAITDGYVVVGSIIAGIGGYICYVFADVIKGLNSNKPFKH